MPLRASDKVAQCRLADTDPYVQGSSLYNTLGCEAAMTLPLAFSGTQAKPVTHARQAG